LDPGSTPGISTKKFKKFFAATVAVAATGTETCPKALSRGNLPTVFESFPTIFTPKSRKRVEHETSAHGRLFF